MESDSECGTPTEIPKPRIADMVGTVIAFLTLTLPLWAIAYYSSGEIDIIPGTNYPIRQVRE
ncbi:hypothetical protein [Roseofilum casamattae]|uniref:Uncharacterized protein n=1 Tax=Roseofilum casamattae BLCC-M143 TaxID=3022442 RepID=A0ABT7BTG9_9CYAN|nr:hypothetical protein [Roseofilum casamattae]MDJ1181598.1 hypothetical protein [Roseofilum casamattae BLCC-M143]